MVKEKQKIRIASRLCQKWSVAHSVARVHGMCHMKDKKKMIVSACATTIEKCIRSEIGKYR